MSGEALLPLVQETFSTDGETSTLREGYLWVSTSEEKKWPIKMLVESEKEGTRVTLERDRVDQLRGNYIGASLFMIVATCNNDYGAYIWSYGRSDRKSYLCYDFSSNWRGDVVGLYVARASRSCFIRSNH